jgi:uncharacterized membrane protein
MEDTNLAPMDASTDRFKPISSTSTLFWRLFVPIFSTGMLTCLMLAFWLTSGDELYLPVDVLWVRIGLLVLWAAWIYFMWRTLWRLRRVDANATHFVVTDYWTSVRYPWDDVASTSESRHLGRRIAHIHLRGAGRFGQKISFLPASHYTEWMGSSTLKFSTLALLLLSVVSCQSGTSGDAGVAQLGTSATPPLKEYKGILRYQNGAYGFINPATGLMHTVLDSTGTLIIAYKKACMIEPAPGEPVYAAVRGRILPSQMSTDPGMLAVVAIDSVGTASWLTEPLDFAFYCSGTEPFWSLNICKSPAGMFFKNWSGEKSATYELNTPVIKDDKEWTYSGKNVKDPTQAITVTIRTAPCNDGMSDMKFNYEASVKVNGTTFRGCAVRKGEPLPKE